MTSNELEQAIQRSLDAFYERRLNKLQTLQLKDTLRKKNPYLFRAIGIQNAADIVNGLLSAYMSSSDEGIFGDAFFEPIAILVSRGTVASGAGIDITIETQDTFKAI